MAHPTTYNTQDKLGAFASATTLKDAGVSTYIAKQQLADGLIQAAGAVKTGKRGRPATKYTLTQKGREALGSTLVAA